MEKWCSKCKGYHPANEEYFYQDKRSKTKLSSWCRKCQRAAVVSVNQKSNPVKGDGDNTLILDFSDADMLLADLQAEAVTDFRTTEMQALYLISKGLFKGDNQNGRA